MKKRLLSIILCLCMMLTIAPASAFAGLYSGDGSGIVVYNDGYSLAEQGDDEVVTHSHCICGEAAPCQEHEGIFAAEGFCPWSDSVISYTDNAASLYLMRLRQSL